MTEREAKESVVKAGIRLVESGLIARTWGNVSCRLSNEYFVITPSGRDYLSLTIDDIVTVTMSDLSYQGNIKPSGEKAVHAEVYCQYPEANFVIHTHQEEASIISTFGLDYINSDLNLPLIGDKIICASYGLPGTKKLRKGVADALRRTKGNAIIMKCHGALCFGKDAQETFLAASDLEKACYGFITSSYKKVGHTSEYNDDRMRQMALERITKKLIEPSEPITFCNSERISNGFKLIEKSGKEVKLRFNQVEGSYAAEARIHNEIYINNKHITHIMHKDSPDMRAVSRADRKVYPLVDDFAQIIGAEVKTITDISPKTVSVLKKTSAIFVRNYGAYCCGASQGDAAAVQMIMEKNCKALLRGVLFGKGKPIGWLDRKLMRFVYLKKYSKQIGDKN